MILLLIAGSFNAKSQSLKDLLFSGKLKSDSNTVVKRTDDLSTKIDTAQKKAEPEKPKAGMSTDVTGKPVAVNGNNGDSLYARDSAVATSGTAGTIAAPVRNNNKIWKDYTDSLVATLRSEVLTSKKIKSQTYYVTVDYEADVDGQVSVTNVTVLPENSYLQDQVKQRLTLTPPQLAPTFDSANKARKVKRKYNFTVVKD